jgi:AraC-like DNA-binding protein
MDTVSDILRSLRLTGGVFLEARLTAPWCVAAQIGPDDCGPYLPRPHNVIAYHYVAEGRLLLEMGDAAPVEASAGELLVLPRNDPHRLASAPGLKAVRAESLVQKAARGALSRIEHGGGGAATRILCGFLGNDARADPVVASLPGAMKLGLAEGLSGPWVESSMRFSAAELAAGAAGSASVLAKVAELLFTEAVRRHLASLPQDQDLWTAGLGDAAVGRGIELLHNRLAEPWTAEALAREVGLSRSAFAERFTQAMGHPPMHYLARLRLETAARRLRETQTAIAVVAYDVGYESEAAFSRAFKRQFGAAPGAWRRKAVNESR